MINKINKFSKSEFTKAFANIFENASWIAEKLYGQKPFSSYEELSLKMINIFEKSSKEKKLEILNAHPDLADKAKIALLTPDSKKEQNSVGLDKCTEEEFKEFRKLNIEYKTKFGFPFIIAVKGKNKNEILVNFRERIQYDLNKEFFEAKNQVKKIASLRLKDILSF